MNQDRPCRHEYIKIFQRKLKGVERRLVSTRAYLPTGFSSGDLGHLGEGSYSFCTRCRVRLYPRRTQAEKAAVRLAAAAARQAELDVPVLDQVVAAGETTQAIDVEELEVEGIDVQDIEAEGVKLAEDDQLHQLSDDQ